MKVALFATGIGIMAALALWEPAETAFDRLQKFVKKIESREAAE